MASQHDKAVQYHGRLFSKRAVLPLGGVRQRLETFVIVTTWEQQVLPASTRWSPGMQLSALR